MSKTPLFCKERTPQNILIPHVNNKILSHLPVPAPRVLGGWQGRSPPCAGSSAVEGQAELGVGRRRQNQVLLHVVLFRCDFCLLGVLRPPGFRVFSAEVKSNRRALYPPRQRAPSIGERQCLLLAPQS